MAAETPTVANCDVAMLARIIEQAGEMPVEVARFLLKLDFMKKDKDRVNTLSAKAQQGTLSEAERAELEDYIRVGYELGILQSKARIALKRAEARAV